MSFSYYSAQSGGLIVTCSGTSNSSSISCKMLINNCYASGNAFSNSTAGGLIGYCSSNWTNSVLINNSYATGTASADNECGLVGRISGDNITVENSYRLPTICDNFDHVGIVLTQDEMRTKSSFVGWDFYKIWYYIDGINNGYPILLLRISK